MITGMSSSFGTGYPEPPNIKLHRTALRAAAEFGVGQAETISVARGGAESC